MTQIETRYGPLSVPERDGDLIVQHLARYGEWAWCEARFVASLLDDNAAVLDGGAFLGTFGLGVAAQRPLRLLCAVEANPEAAGFLRDNLMRLAPCRQEMVEAILTGAAPVAEAGHAELGNLGSTSFVMSDAHDGEAETSAAKAVMTLSELRERFGAFDLVKLDIEGMELPVLTQDAMALSRGTTAIWAECNESPRSLILADFLLSIGLPLWYFAFPSHNRANVRGVAEAIFPMGFEAGLLAAPPREPELDPALTREGCVLRRIGSTQELREAMWLTPRWGRPGWEFARSREELAAIAGRDLLGQDERGFLVSAEAGLPAPQSIWEKLAATEAGLTEAQGLLAASRDERTQLMARQNSDEQAKVTLSGNLAEALERTGRAEARAEAAEAALARMEAALREACEARQRAEDRVRDIETEAETRVKAALSEARIAVEEAEAEAARQAARRMELLAMLGKTADPPGAPEFAAVAMPEAILPSQTDHDEAEALRERLRQLETSTSWLITAPVRAVMGRQKLLKRSVRLGRRLAGKAVRRVRGDGDL